MKVDRTLQKLILDKLYEEHPYSLTDNNLASLHPENPELITSNLLYLSDHGLIQLVRSRHAPLVATRDDELLFLGARITSKGIDFLEDDGGLSAILGVVTVKLHDETIQALLAGKVEASNLPPEEKQTLLKQIRDLRGEAAKHLVTKLIDYGLTQGPNAMQWLSEAFKQLQ